MQKPRSFRTTCHDALVPRRWCNGEIGIELPGNFEPYFCKLELPGVVTVELFNRPMTAKRIFHFFKDEVELVEESDEKELGSEVARDSR